MRGDRLVLAEGHIKAARQALHQLLPAISACNGRFIVTIAGESGSGKSEIAAALSAELAEQGIGSCILQQDDYFVYPPKTNEATRRQDISHVGMSEVRLDVLDENLRRIRSGETHIAKPLVDFDADRILEETASIGDAKVVIVDGTYTTTLANVDRHIFIDRDLNDTREARLRRSRETQDGFLERVLEIEHGIISTHKAMADLIVSKEYEVSIHATV